MASGRFGLSPLLSKRRTLVNKQEFCDILLADTHAKLTELMTSTVDQEELARNVLYLFRNTRRMKELLLAVFDGVTADSLREESNSLRVHILACISKYGQRFLDDSLDSYLSEMKKRVRSKTVEEWTTLLLQHIKKWLPSLPDPVKLVCQVLYSKSKQFRCLCGYFFLRFLCPALMKKVMKLDSKMGKLYHTAREVGDMLMAIGNASDNSNVGKTAYIAAKAKEIETLFVFKDLVDSSGWNYTSSPLVGSECDRRILLYFSQHVVDGKLLKDKHPVGLIRVKSDERLNAQLGLQPSPRAASESDLQLKKTFSNRKLKRLTVLSSFLNSSQQSMSSLLKLSPRKGDDV